MDTQNSILIVEDEKSIRDALIDKFTNRGFLVHSAQNGEEGLTQAFTHKPDMILLDIIMPKIDGIGMLEKLRLDPWGKQAPVFVLTNINDADKIAEVTALDCFDYIVKSDWHIDDVVTKVMERLHIS